MKLSTMLLILLWQYGMSFPQACRANEAGTQPYRYIGNNYSFKFHRPTCPFAQAMMPEHRIYFQFRKVAIAQGQKPCRYCLPPTWTSVRGVVLTPLKSKPSVPSEEIGRLSPDRQNENDVVRF